ncbi:hypothetical protein DTL42_16110 [Bremerella cremea]|uniref:Uncharacterized protein n=2 Tax=Bremerella cremea TaxID=1031537 RepID=A0A368KPR6_9BACT|nr:hypothetical protein DTL42_16110 [Bremerella cremea]
MGDVLPFLIRLNVQMVDDLLGFFMNVTSVGSTATSIGDKEETETNEKHEDRRQQEAVVSKRMTGR